MIAHAVEHISNTRKNRNRRSKENQIGSFCTRRIRLICRESAHHERAAARNGATHRARGVPRHVEKQRERLVEGRADASHRLKQLHSSSHRERDRSTSLAKKKKHSRQASQSNISVEKCASNSRKRRVNASRAFVVRLCFLRHVTIEWANNRPLKPVTSKQNHDTSNENLSQSVLIPGSGATGRGDGALYLARF